MGEQLSIEQETLLGHDVPQKLHRRHALSWLFTSLLLLSNLVFGLGWAITWFRIDHAQNLRSSSTLPSTAKQALHDNIASVHKLPQRPVQFHWYTRYSSLNYTESESAWNDINTAHGYIAVDHEYAEQNNWSPSMAVPEDGGKALYLLESYHQLHCLKIVRKLFFESQAGLPLTLPVQHVRHCFDAFRQFIMCHADATPLYTLGHHTSGDGQWHMCNDWSALRQYATERSACFHDRVGHEAVEDQFGDCDDGSDGLVVDEPAIDLSSIMPG
ncbi:hypothetical protein CB0940_05850 [Cercospora beticola]|uniref:Uncharacterized protein n=1 Tax=Cercospora beticola TaxID=122368 RepID=A0A2G5I0E6_CERBT|nr:hypothetical protein CB0940_05850 [Cercospora beticola]PIA98269.1 hypothetical protein CB0940_05850 [Cercospora beticola]WPA98443.1 hypothetical protein RHO25_003055 [Cercospora beticola]